MIERLGLIGMSFIPLFLGILGFWNNLYSDDYTMRHIIYPLLNMNTVRDVALHDIRAIYHPTAGHTIYIFMNLLHLILGLLAGIGIIKMCQNLKQDDILFKKAKDCVKLSCVLGMLIWGLGFFTIAGDYFLSWQNPKLFLQDDGLKYFLVVFATYVVLQLG